MKLYIAASSQSDAFKLREQLEHRGHEITARWIVEDTKFNHGAYNHQERESLALIDEADVWSAEDGLVLLAEPEGRNVPGGKHVEMGMALALLRPIFIIGRRENIFHWHPRVAIFDRVGDFLEFLDALHPTSRIDTLTSQ